MKKINIRVIVFYAISLLAIVGLCSWLIPQVRKEMSKKTPVVNTPVANQPIKGNVDKNQVVRISLDEWIGWQPLLDANEGLKTTPNSINGKNGLNIEYVITNDANTSSTALIKGDLSGSGYTINRYAFLQEKLNQAGVKVVMPYISNFSNGGDGIIAKDSIKKVEDLVGKRIGVPRFSEAQTLIEWLIRNSNLSKADQDSIRNSMLYFDGPEDAGKAFFSGKVDAAATWEPFLTQAKTTAGTRILFDTSMSTNLILDGIVFREDFVNKNEAFIVKFIDCAIQAKDMYKKEFKNIKKMPMFELMSNDEIIAMASSAELTSWKDNKNLLKNEALTVYKDMSNIWLSIGEKAYPELAKTAFTDKYVLALSSKYEAIVEPEKQTNFTADKKEQAINKEALMSKTLDIKFEPDSIAIMPESYPALNEFVETAKILNNTIIQLEGNTAKVSNSNGKEFSQRRAASVAKYLQSQGIDPVRFILIGNGDTKPIGDNNTDEGKAKNRRTGVFFKTVGY